MDYIPHTTEDIQQMLKTIGVGRFEDLLTDIPASLRIQGLKIPEGLSEMEVVDRVNALAQTNLNSFYFNSFLGAGMYEHFIPSAVDALSSRGEFATAYTPYQPEASQGTLQAMYEYQTMVCELTGMDVANASLYDGASSLAEAALVAMRATERSKMIVSEAIHPEYREVVHTYLQGAVSQVVHVPAAEGITDLNKLRAVVDDATAAVLVQYPNFFGGIESLKTIAEIAHKHGALVVVSAYPIALGLLESPGACDADIVVGEGQCLGNYMSYGGPTLGLFATRKSLVRKMPGRIAGRTVDHHNRCGYVLTLQAREQHIRREKATSNICTNEGLLTLRAAVYLSLLGPQGLREVAHLCLQKAHYAFDRLTSLPWVKPAFNQPFFNEFVVQYEGRSVEEINRALWQQQIVGGLDLSRWYPSLGQSALFCVTELKPKAHIDALVDALEGIR